VDEKECELVVDAYMAWLRKETDVEQIGHDCLITTPFVDQHGNWIEIRVSKQGDQFILSDGGTTMYELEMSELDINIPKYKEIIKATLDSLGREMKCEEIVAQPLPGGIGKCVHDFIQAVIVLSDVPRAIRAETNKFYCGESEEEEVDSQPQEKVDNHSQLILCYDVRVRKLTASEGGGFMAWVPSLGESSFIGDGDTREEAVESLLNLSRKLVPEIIKGLPKPDKVGWLCQP